MLKLYFDGGCLPKNPGGVATYGFAIFDTRDIMVHSGYGIAGNGIAMTNNVAEYSGLLNGLKAIRAKFPEEDSVDVYGDSQLVVNMVNRVWGKYEPHKKAPHLALLLEEVNKVIAEFKECKTFWIPRELNSLADSLTDKAYKDYKAGKLLSGESNEQAEVRRSLPIPVEKFTAAKTFIESFEFYLCALGIKDIRKTKEVEADVVTSQQYELTCAGEQYVVSIKKKPKNGKT